MVERRIIEYKTVMGMGVNMYDFDKEINELLKEGWELHGTPYSTTNTHPYTTGIKYQALVRYEGRITSG